MMSIVMMVVGQTGSGKTTLLNSFINFIMGLQLEDDFRYVIIDENTGTSQAFSQTEKVNIYCIKSHNGYPPIKIVDTPGFGDTRGIEMDKVITDQIADAFTNKISTINAVCFVAQSSNARLTANQKYIFNKVMELFGRDIAENFVVMLTFCDGSDPQILAALQEKNSVFDQIIHHIKSPWYLKFNNSAIFSKHEDDFTEMFWKLGMKNFRSFMDKLTFLPKKSLSQSKEVLTERKKLENTIISLQPLLNQGLSNLDSLRELLNDVSLRENEINASKNYTKVISKPKCTKVGLAPGIFTTTCLTCSFTCHNNCAYSNDKDKINCCAMTNGKCINCPKKCDWQVHSNVPHIFEYTMVNEIVTLKDLEFMFFDAGNKKAKSQQIIEGMGKSLKQISMDCLRTQEQIRNSANRLKQIALNSNVFESSEEYVELMILSEENEKKTGWQNRIKSLMELNKQHKMIRDIYKGKKVTEDFEKIANDLKLEGKGGLFDFLFKKT